MLFFRSSKAVVIPITPTFDWNKTDCSPCSRASIPVGKIYLKYGNSTVLCMPFGFPHYGPTHWVICLSAWPTKCPRVVWWIWTPNSTGSGPNFCSNKAKPTFEPWPNRLHRIFGTAYYLWVKLAYEVDSCRLTTVPIPR